ncbi:MAG: autotransporter domain-containing protein, partial [Gammaproteobacteria bacterium]|nr:autotransporter domain-containing protein [Gammaproteobacteria bacterium]
TLIVTDDDGLTDNDTVVITVNAGNTAPTANAGPNQAVTDTDNNGSESVALNGNGSSDSDGEIASFQWLENGNEIASGAAPTVNLAVGRHTITLRVTDDDGLTDNDTVVITVNAGPTAPAANAGPDQTVTDTDNTGSEQVTLNGSGSSDADGQIANFQWLENGQEIALGATPTVTLAVGTHNISLRVTDNGGLTAEDQVIITVIAGNTAPTANAGPDQTVTDSDNNGSEQLTLDGSASTDDNAIASYEWFENNQSLANGVQPTVNLGTGTHTITLRVTDDNGLTSEDQVVVTVAVVSANDQGSRIELISGTNQRLSVGQTTNPFRVRVLTENGQPVEDVQVDWSLSPAGAGNITVAGGTTTTNSDGETSTTLTVLQPGPITLTASVSNVGSVDFGINRFASTPGLTENQSAVAGALDKACPALGSLDRDLTAAEQDLLNTCNALATESDGNLGNAFQQLAPDEVAAQGKTQVSLAKIRSRNVLSRLDYLRGGATGPSLEGLSLAIGNKSFPLWLAKDMAADGRSGGAAGDEGGLVSRWGIFVNGSISFGDADTTDREPGFDFDTAGLTVGVDYRLTDEFIIGSAFNYISTDTKFDNDGGKLDTDGYGLSLYTTYYQSERAFIDGVISFGSNDYQNRRNIRFSNIDQPIDSDTDGSEYSIDIGTGYEFQRQALTFIPQARFHYTRVDIDGYNEQATDPNAAGAGLALEIEDQKVESLRTALGGQLSYALSTSFGVLLPHVLIEWEHEFKDDSRLITARFLNDPTRSDILLRTDSPDSDFFNLGAGISATFRHGISGFLYYETTLQQDNISQDSVIGGVRVEF